MRRVLLLGGLDPSGGAGVTLDATVASLHGILPLPVALSTTVQGARGFFSADPIPPRVWREQVRTVVGDEMPAAIKVGYVGSAAVAAELAEVLRPLAARAPLIVDPVLSATAGGMRPEEALTRVYVDALLPMAALVCPNTPELQELAVGDAEVLLRSGVRAVLHKGGHGSGGEAVDVLWTSGAPDRFVRPRRPCGPVRGTGCALASAIASHFASGADARSACLRAGDWLSRLLAATAPRSDGLPQTLPLSRGETFQ